MTSNYKSGIISINGLSNVGKSTILNQIINKEISITSDLKETTRNKIKWIYQDQDARLIFIDTPGFVERKNLLHKKMNSFINESFMEADLIIYVTHIKNKNRKLEVQLIDKIKNNNAICIINKVDMIKNKNKVLEFINYYNKNYNFKEFIPISAFDKNDINYLISKIKNYLNDKTDMNLFYDNYEINQNNEFIASEIIRKEIIENTFSNIANNVLVEFEFSEYDEDRNLMNLYFNILVNNKSQKPIIIGKKATKLARIRDKAKKKIIKQLGFNINLHLYVKVSDNWKNNETKLANLGKLND